MAPNFRCRPKYRPGFTLVYFMATPELPAPRLVRTTHTDDGTSVFASDSELTPSLPFGPQASAFTVLDVRTSLPASNTEPVPDLDKTLPRCPPGGVVCFVTDMRPNSSAPMHRTLTLDFRRDCLGAGWRRGEDGLRRRVYRAARRQSRLEEPH